MDRLIGVLLVALFAGCFGTNAIFARMAYDAGANASTFLFIRFAIASLVMFLISLQDTDIGQRMPNYPAFKERTVKIVSGGSCNLCTRVGVLTDEMAGLY